MTITKLPLPDVHARPSCLCDESELRATFTQAMSTMYRSEVPLYGDLIRLVQESNEIVANRNEITLPERLELERHGAIRLGLPSELHTMGRVFGLLGLHPVDYYDLSVAGLPMHATAFRPITSEALSKNAFRVFATLLRPELLRPIQRELALSLLNSRKIFTDELMSLVKLGEEQGGLSQDQGLRFITEALQTFKWHSTAAASYEDYQLLAEDHPILADVACFNSSHINHLTPRTLDIELAEAMMRKEGFDVKQRIEGPPLRQFPVLLRQTSFLALQESVSFPVKGANHLVKGQHRARFGEIEQRGAAVTKKGRDLYDQILIQALHQLETQHEIVREAAYQKAFQKYPDDWKELLKQGLVYGEFRCTDRANEWKPNRLETAISLRTLVEEEILEADPITYEDFLPFSAAGIFRSNLSSTADDEKNGSSYEGFDDSEQLATALGCSVYDSQDLYASIQTESLAKCAKLLNVREIVVDTT